MPVIDTGRVFEIYSVGDGEFMRRVMDSVAAMSNSGLLLQLVGFGLMIGLLIMGFRNVIAGGNKLDLGTTLVAVMLGGIMFGLKADVIIHDMNFAPGETDQPSYRVDNVPFGIAAAGYLISGTGFALTEKMEQGYGLYAGGRSSLIEGGFGNTLEWINSLRMWEVPTFNDSGKEVGRFRENLGAYVNECTLPGIEMGHLRYDAIVTNPNVFSMGDASGNGGFGYASQYVMFQYTQANGTKTALTCGDGFATIQADSGNVLPQFAEALSRAKLGMSSEGMAAAQAMEDSFATIGIDAGQMQQLVLAEAVGLSLHNAVSGKTSSAALSTQTKMMIEQASTQRAVQWAAEETMFRRVMRPMMAFFESLLYALAPLMALMIGMGSFGMQTVMKYMMLSIWVILWLPMLSIVQLYQVTMMQHGVNGLQVAMDGLGTGVGTSIAGADQVRQLAIDWLGTGAAMAAFTPALTMMLVWGGGAAASALAGRMQGSDQINEKQTAPDASATPPAIATGSSFAQSKTHGMTVADSLGGMPTMNTSTITGYGEASTVGRLQSAQTQYMAAVQRAMESTYGDSVSFSATSGTSHAGGRSGQNNAQWSAGADATATQGVDGAMQAQVNTSNASTQDVTAKASGGLEVAGIGATASTTGNNREAQEVADLIRAARTGGGGTSQRAGHGAGQNFTEGQTIEDRVQALAKSDQNFAQNLRDNDTFNRAQTALDQAQASYVQSGTFEQRYGSNQNVSFAQAGQDFLARGGSGASAMQAAQSVGLGDQANWAASTLFKGIVGEDARMAAGAMYALYQGSQQTGGFGVTEAQSAERRDALLSLVNGGPMEMGGYLAGAVKPSTNAGMQTETPDRAALRDRVTGNTPGSGVDAGGLRNDVEDSLVAGSAAQAQARAEVQGIVPANPGAYGPAPRSHADAVETVSAAGGNAMAPVEAAAYDNAADHAVGLGDRSRKDSQDNTNVDAIGTMLQYGPDSDFGLMPQQLPEGGAVEARIAQMRETNPELSAQQQNFLAVAAELRENGNNAVTQSQYQLARHYMDNNETEAEALADRYGRGHGGTQEAFEDGLRQEADQRLRDNGDGESR